MVGAAGVEVTQNVLAETKSAILALNPEILRLAFIAAAVA
jgi:hypothetical protein